MNKTLIRRYLSYFVIIDLTAAVISFQAGRMIRLTSYRQTEATLQEAATAYASGNLDYYLKINHPLDLKQMADSLNIMAENMKQRIVEVTARKNELHSVFSSMVEAVVVLDGELKIQDLNPSACKLINTELEQASGRSLLDVFRNAELFNFAKMTLADAVLDEHNITLAAGGEVYLQVHGALLPGDPQKGSHGGIVLVFNDITRLTDLMRSWTICSVFPGSNSRKASYRIQSPAI